MAETYEPKKVQFSKDSRPAGECCSCVSMKARDASLEFTPDESRDCTDVIMFILFLLSIVGTFILIGIADSKGGDPTRVLSGTNWNGTLCGTGDQSDKPLAAWPDIFEWEVKECVASCAETATWGWSDKYSSHKLVGWCIPEKVITTFNDTAQAGADIDLPGDFGSSRQTLSRANADLWTAWPIILASCFIALLMTFLYTWLSRWLVKCMILFMIIMVTGAGFLMGWTLFNKAEDIDDANSKQGMQILGGIMVGLSFIFLIVIFAMRTKILIASEVLKEASRAVLDMMWMTFWPIIPLIVALFYTLYWIYLMLYLMSVSENIEKPLPDSRALENDWARMTGQTAPFTYVDNVYDEQIKDAFWYALFQYFWVIEFIIYFSYMVVAGSVANWYFTRRDASGNKVRGNEPDELPEAPVWAAFCRTFRFHQGSVAFGAFIMAVIMTIRAIVHYLEEQFKPRGAEDKCSGLRKCAFCFVNCCLSCLQYCADKCNKNAYVWIAIWGTDFVPACCSSFDLVWANLARALIISTVGQVMLTVGKVSVSIMTAAICAVMADKAYGDELSSLSMPTLMTFVLAYVIASLAMNVFDTTIDAIFLCFLVDEKFNTGGSMYAHPDLQQLIHRYAPANQEKHDLPELQPSHVHD